MRVGFCLVGMLGGACGQTSRPDGSTSVVAMDHLEAKGVTAWIVESSAGRSLVVARGGSGPVERLRGVPMRDVMLDPAGRTAFLLVERGKRFALEELVLDGGGEPRVMLRDLATPIVLPNHATSPDPWPMGA